MESMAHRPELQGPAPGSAVRRSVLRNGDRVLFVDDWAASGGQALACQHLVHEGGATWLGAAVVLLEDCRAGLTIDDRDERADRAAGRRLRQPLLVLWSTRDDLADLHGDPATSLAGLGG